MDKSLCEEIKQLKIYPPGAEVKYTETISVNDLYYCYSSTMTVVVYLNKTNRLKAILNLVKDKYLRALALNKGKNHEIAIFYDYEILIYSLKISNIIQRFKINYVSFMEFNSSNLLIVLTNTNELYYCTLFPVTITKLNVYGSPNNVKWFPFNCIDYIYSNTSNQLNFCSINQKNRKCYIDLGKDDTVVKELQWYETDENYKYVLVGFENCEITLCDLNESFPCVIMNFDKYGTSLGKIIWMKDEPGSFFVTYKGSSRVSIWNVSRKNYKEITKFSDSPIMNCISFPDGKKILSTIENGEVQIYDLLHRKKSFIISPGHSETVFDLKFSPFNEGMFATVAYDGLIKIWDLSSDSVIFSLVVNEPGSLTNPNNPYDSTTRMYSIKWSPIDKQFFLTGDSKSTLRIWDIEKQKQICSLILNTLRKGEIIGIDWSEDNHILATCMEYCYICLFEGKTILKINSISLNSRGYQIKFSILEEKKFAVACNDGNIRFYLTSQKDQSENKKFKGHSQKVFGIAFNPKYNILASSSDDFKVGIWDIDKGSPKFLMGHTNNVRQLIFLPQDPKVLISGSWDGTVRFWNINMQMCIGIIYQHQSDVYGIDIPKYHPFLLATSSRDNSIRFWCYLKNPIDLITNFDNDTNMDILNKYPYLDNDLKSNAKEGDIITRAEIIAKFFFYNDYLTELFDTLKVVQNKKEHGNEQNKLFYIGDLYSAYKSKILGLEFQYFNIDKFDYFIKKEDILRKAIDISSKCGDWEKFCELSIELGEWKKAIMAAPHVSISYWNELNAKYAEYLNKESEVHYDDKIKASLQCNEYNPAIKQLIDNEKYNDSIIVWIDKTLKKINNKIKPKKEESYNEEEYANIEDIINNIESNNEITNITNVIVEKNLNVGNIIQAASVYLSIKDITRCIKTLLRGNEIEIAYIIMKLTNDKTYEYDILMHLLSKQIKLGSHDKCNQIISIASTNEIKIYLYYFALRLNKVKDIDKAKYENLIDNYSDNNIKLLKDKNYSSLLYIIKQISNKIAIDLKENKFNEINILNLINFFNISILFNWEDMQENIFNQLYTKILCTALLFETLNKNTKSIYILLKELVTFNNPQYQDENDIMMIKIANSYYIKKKNNSQFTSKLKLTPKENIDIELYCKLFQNCNDKKIIKYYCDNMNKFYVIKEEMFPMINKNIQKSFISQKIIQGKIVNLKEFIISQSQAMERFKFISKGFNTSKTTFLPC